MTRAIKDSYMKLISSINSNSIQFKAFGVALKFNSEPRSNQWRYERLLTHTLLASVLGSRIRDVPCAYAASARRAGTHPRSPSARLPYPCRSCSRRQAPSRSPYSHGYCSRTGKRGAAGRKRKKKREKPGQIETKRDDLEVSAFEFNRLPFRVNRPR